MPVAIAVLRRSASVKLMYYILFTCGNTSRKRTRYMHYRTHRHVVSRGITSVDTLTPPHRGHAHVLGTSSLSHVQPERGRITWARLVGSGLHHLRYVILARQGAVRIHEPDRPSHKIRAFHRRDHGRREHPRRRGRTYRRRGSYIHGHLCTARGLVRDPEGP